MNSHEEERVEQKRQKLDREFSVKSKKKKNKREHKQSVAEPEPASLMEDEELVLHPLISCH